MANTSKESPKTKTKKETTDIFSLEDIGDLLQVLKANEVTEFKLERANERLSLKRGNEGAGHVAAAPVAQAAPAAPVGFAPVESAPAQFAPAQSAPAQAVPAQAVPAPIAAAPAASSAVEEVSSPMVGTFYSRPSPDADSYVNVGDIVKKGDKLCIIEAMKIMNEIEADKSGKIVSICLEDGQMVEFGEPLFKLEAV